MIPVAKEKAVGAPLPFYREKITCRKSTGLGSVFPAEVSCHVFPGFLASMAPFPFCPHNTDHVPIVSYKDFVPKMGLNPEAYPWIFCHPPCPS